MGHIYAIANQKGGVGKTTTAVNLGAGLALRGKSVLLVDLDPQGNAGTALGIAKTGLENTLYDVLINGMDPKEAIRPTQMPTLWVLPCTVTLAGAEVELVERPAREHLLRQALERVAPLYDVVLVDCPPSLSLLTINALVAATRVVVPIQCEFFALEGVAQLMETVRLVKQRLNPALTLHGIVLTMYDGRTNLSPQVVEEVKKYFASKLFRSIIPRNVRLAEAPSHSLPVFAYDPRSPGAEAYMALVDEFLARE